MNDDPTGTAAKMLTLALQSASTNCVNAVSPDGTWSETSDYWWVYFASTPWRSSISSINSGRRYFGSQAHAQMSSALLTATGSTQQLLSANPAFNLTGMYHMYVYGNTCEFTS